MKITVKQPLIISVLLALATAVSAQQKRPVNQFVDFTAGIGNSQGSVAVSYIHNWQFGKKKKLEIGLGGRFTSYFGNDKFYRTAPAKLTSGKTGPGVLFADDIQENIDTVFFSKAQINSVNLSINLGYNINRKLSLGLNIDAIGFSFGGNKNGSFLNSNPIKPTTAKPTAFNLLLISDNDLGSLNSELFVKYQLSREWGLKLGYQFLFTEYKTGTLVQTTPAGDQNDRFRNKVSALALGVSYRL